MDFILSLSKTTKKHDAFMVVVEKLSKIAHLVAIKSAYTKSDISQVFMMKIMKLHGVPKKIIFHGDAKFTS